MIIVKISGGLGNQLFQYALGRRLAILNNQELFLDISYFRIQSLRLFELDKFKIRAQILSDEENQKYNQGIHERLARYLSRLNIVPKAGYIKECRAVFDRRFLKLGPNVIIDGFFQTEKYFKGIRKQILSEIKLIDSPDQKNAKTLSEIDSCESVCLHIRRGDYISNPDAAKIHGLCDLDYYFKGVKYLNEKLINPHYFIFSDDLEWAKNNLKIEAKTTFVDNNDTSNGYEDLRLMTRCKYFIIANSSFSWWGAWLSEFDKKIVIAPKLWFLDSSKSNKDIIPESWIRL